jgi:thioester reductase-like protein
MSIQPLAPLSWKERVVRFYADLSRVSSPTALLRFAPLTSPPPAGFSWLRAALDPAAAAAHGPLVEAAHNALRQRMVEGLQSTDVCRAVDLGCGNGADAVWLATQFPHARVDGCNISPEEIDIGRAHAAVHGLTERVKFYHCDLAHESLPGCYDFALALQVIHHIRDKEAACRNIGTHLREGGRLVLAESVSNSEADWQTTEATSTLVTRDRWASLLANHGLRLIEVLDASAAVARYLDDREFEANLAVYGARLDPVSVAHLRLFDRVGRLLRKGAISYLVMRAHKDNSSGVEQLLAANRAAFTAGVPLGGALAAAPVSISSEDTLFAQGDDVAHWVRARIATALEADPDRIDEEVPLVDFGLDSLVAHELKTLLRHRLGVDIPVLDFLNGATMRSLLERIRPGRSSSAPTSHTSESDLQLIDTLETREPGPQSPEPRSWLLTGATGFLGVHLLTRMLETTDAAVTVLVRAPDASSANRKLEAALQRALQMDHYHPHASRVQVVAADLTQPNLGLDANGWATLADSVDGIIHAAAATNFLDGYDTLRPANVIGTLTLLRLAQSGGRVRPFHYVSSGHVLYDPFAPEQRWDEHSPAEANRTLRTGYQQSKWVAEQLAAHARHKGIPVALYRPAWIEGHSRTGVFNQRDFLCNFLRACAVLQAAPLLDLAVNFTPVDYTADAIASLARRGCRAAPHAWHVVDPSPATNWTDHVAALRRAGYRIEDLPCEQWLERAAGSAGRAAGFAPWLDVLGHFAGAAQSNGSLGLPWLDASVTQAALQEVGLTWRSPGHDFLDHYVHAFIDQGFLPRGSR